MKRVVCLLVIVSIAYVGCADTKQKEVTVISGLLDRVPDGTWGDPEDVIWDSPSVVRLKIANMHKRNEALMFRIDELEAALESQRAVSRVVIAKLQGELRESKIMHKQNKALLVRIAKLEAVTESQSAVIKSSKNVHRLHEVALEYQRVALDSLLNLCRLYEAKIESQRAEIEVLL